MNKIILTSILSAACLTASAQDSYNAAEILQTDLIGSARYVGMGGALNALGADISLMSSNPAGTALYRRSDVGFTVSSLTTGQEAELDNNRSRMSFDQAGVLFAFQVDNSGNGLQYVNFGVNYKKNKNFFGNNFVHVGHLENEWSQTIQIADLAEDCWQSGVSNWGLLADLSAEIHNDRGDLIKPGIIGSSEETGYYGYAAKDANYRRATTGSNIDADINVSFNDADRYYYGLSIGIHDIDYSRSSFYEELGVDNVYYYFDNWYRISGTGFDLKFGFVCRPIEDSPFRFGIAVHTPTWYRLTEANGSALSMGELGYDNESCIGDGDSGDYDYKLQSPWKFNLSVGHTIGTKVALGAEYEYTDMSSSKFSTTSMYEYDDREYMNDKNRMLSKTLKGQHTIKLGAEYKILEPLSLRLGYNLVSSCYNTNGYKVIYPTEPFTETDYTNWKALHRLTVGLGYRWKNGYIDAAYLYQTQKGDFYAFDHTRLKPTSTDNNRSSIMATLGFRF